jgi:hypothetical protein
MPVVIGPDPIGALAEQRAGGEDQDASGASKVHEKQFTGRQKKMCGEASGQHERWGKSRLAGFRPRAVTIGLNTGFSNEAPYRTGGRVLLLQRPPFLFRKRPDRMTD